MVNQALSYLKQEIVEFKRQKEEEIARFEEYKTNEIKKLKYVETANLLRGCGKGVE